MRQNLQETVKAFRKVRGKTVINCLNIRRIFIFNRKKPARADFLNIKPHYVNQIVSWPGHNAGNFSAIIPAPVARKDHSSTTFATCPDR